MEMNRKPFELLHVKSGSCWRHISGNPTSALKAGEAGPLGTSDQWRPSISSLCLLLPSWELKEGRAWPTTLKSQQQLINVHLETPVHPLCNAAWMKHAELFVQQWRGEGQGKAAPGMGTRDSVKWSPLFSHLNSFKPRHTWRTWGRHWPWDTARNEPIAFSLSPV